MKDDYDGAEPSGGSVSAMNLLILGHFTGNPEFRNSLEKVLVRLGPRLAGAALTSYHAGTAQIVIVGQRTAPNTIALRRCVASHYLLFAARLNVEPGSTLEAVGEEVSFIASMGQINGRETAFMCTDFGCQELVTGPQVLAAQLNRLGGAMR